MRENECVPEINPSSSIPELIKFVVNYTFRESEVQNILIEREKKMLTEIQNLKIDLECSQALALLAKLKLEEKLRITKRKCRELADEIEQLRLKRRKNIEADFQNAMDNSASASGTSLDRGGKSVFQDIIEIIDSDDDDDKTNPSNREDSSMNLITKEQRSISAMTKKEDDENLDDRRPARTKKHPYWHNDYICCAKHVCNGVCTRFI